MSPKTKGWITALKAFRRPDLPKQSFACRPGRSPAPRFAQPARLLQTLGTLGWRWLPDFERPAAGPATRPRTLPEVSFFAASHSSSLEPSPLSFLDHLFVLLCEIRDIRASHFKTGL